MLGQSSGEAMSSKVKRKAWLKRVMPVLAFDNDGYPARQAFLSCIWDEVREAGYADRDWHWNCDKQTVGYFVVGSADLS